MAKKTRSREPSGRFVSKSKQQKTALPDKTVTPEKEKKALTQPAANQPAGYLGKSAAYERQPAFEQLISDLPTGQEAPEPEKEKGQWGGARAGAGRKRGPDDLGRVNKLPEKANEKIAPVLKMPFSFWAKTQKLPDLALSDAEAKEWALPITQLIEWYFPGRIPEIAWVWMMMFGSTFNIMDKRLELIDKARKEKAATPESPHGGAGPKPVKTGPLQNQIVTVADIEKASNVQL